MGSTEIRPVRWEGNVLVLIDQRTLPDEERDVVCRNVQDVCSAISNMTVRGAPAIGCAAAYGMVLAGREAEFDSAPKVVLARAGNDLAATRPTAVNLSWAVDRMRALSDRYRDVERLKVALAGEAQRILEEDLASCRAMGDAGAELVPGHAVVMTHCNAGALATAGYGTALGVVRSAWSQGKLERVYACETRPRQQGARLTAWELVHDGIAVTLISDTAAGSVLASGRVSLVVVGADRIAANGDTANKIGTYSLAVLAKENAVPFYVAAPMSTVDMSLLDGSGIVIEERGSEEVTSCGGRRIAPEGVDVYNPAFDVTPARYVSAIITERGVIRAPFQEGFRRLRKPR